MTILQAVSAAKPEPFPRVALHEGVNGRGWPLTPPVTVSANSNPQVTFSGAIDYSVVRSIAKFSHWFVAPVDLYDSRSDAIQAVRDASGNHVKIWAHVQGPRFWTASGPGWAAGLCAAIGPNYLRNRDGSAWGAPAAMYADLSKPGVPEILAGAWSQLVGWQGTPYDPGIMLDYFGLYDQWMVALDPALDLDAWGGDVNAWAAQMAAGKARAASLLRSHYPTATIITNGGPRGAYPGASGHWRENFPNQNGGTWASNILQPNGLLTDATYYSGAPLKSVLSVACNPFDPKAAMLGLASSCLADAIFVVGPSDFDPTVDYRDWWIPEMEPGWLGQALGPAIDGRREFERGWAFVNPTTLEAGFTRK